LSGINSSHRVEDARKRADGDCTGAAGPAYGAGFMISLRRTIKGLRHFGRIPAIVTNEGAELPSVLRTPGNEAAVSEEAATVVAGTVIVY